jgi:hypothetical protein
MKTRDYWQIGYIDKEFRPSAPYCKPLGYTDDFPLTQKFVNLLHVTLSKIYTVDADPILMNYWYFYE